MPKKNKKIWIIEDESSCQFVLQETLGGKYDLVFFDTIAAFKTALFNLTESAFPHLIIADLKLPDESFLKFLTTTGLRDLQHLPFIVVSSVEDTEILEACFEEGAHDYLTKPFSKGELSIKVARILNRFSWTAPFETWESFNIDLVKMSVSDRSGRSVKFTRREFQVFNVLRKSKNGMVTRQEIVAQVWGNASVSTKNLDVHIYNLRRKMAEINVKINFQPPHTFFISCDRVA